MLLGSSSRAYTRFLPYLGAAAIALTVAACQNAGAEKIKSASTQGSATSQDASAQPRSSPAPIKALPSDIELPSDAAVTPPGAAVPKNIAAFSGTWTGNWGGKLNGVLVVQDVQPDGTANVIYAWGNAPVWNTRAGYLRIPGSVEKGVLHVSTRGGDVTYAVQSDGELAGSYLNGQGYRTAGTFRKVKP